MSIAATIIYLMAHFGQPYCCDERDCKPAEDGEVTSVPGGWNVTWPGGVQFISSRSEHVHPSGDHRVWLCRASTGIVRCLFLPGSV